MKVLRIKFGVLLALGFVLLLTCFVFITVSSASYKLNLKALIAYNFPTEDNLNNYLTQVNQAIKSHSRQLNVQEDFSVNDFLLAEKYLYKIALEDSSFIPTFLSADPKQEIHPIDFDFKQSFDENFPLEYSYVQKGLRGAIINNNLNLSYKSQNTYHSKTVTIETINQDPVSETVFFGKKPKENVIQEISNEFNLLIKEDPFFSRFTYPTDKTKLENISLNAVSLSETQNEILSLNESFKIGSLDIKLGNCNKGRTLQIEYNPALGEFVFVDIQSFLDNLCVKQFVQMDGYLLGTCTDCLLYPLNKTHAIKAEYAPEVVPVDFAPGGQSINKLALEDFRELYKAAKASNVNLMVTSGYRTYYDQLNTFNYWTSVEMAKGYSRSYAEQVANSYSARPGFSEHQLGTALDLNGAGCDSFNGVCTGNQTAWDWLAANAYKYGFVISYPYGKDSLTGYIFEPWHYRWIGKELAAEYRQVESQGDMYLQKWLFDLGRY